MSTRFHQISQACRNQHEEQLLYMPRSLVTEKGYEITEKNCQKAMKGAHTPCCSMFNRLSVAEFFKLR